MNALPTLNDSPGIIFSIWKCMEKKQCGPRIHIIIKDTHNGVFYVFI